MLIERGGPAPSWLDEEPFSLTGDAFYMQAFWDLSTERQLGFTVGPIPESAIQRYPGVECMSPAMIVLFKTVIRSMDQTYREWAESERKKAQKKSSSTDSKRSHIGPSTEPK